MPAHVFHQLVFHITWATKQRHPFLTEKPMRDWMIGRIEEEARKRYGIVYACNAMPDHVHLLVSLSPTVLLSDFIGQIKGAATRAHHREFGATRFSDWQKGYGVVTLRKSELPIVTRYIANQEAIHESRKTWPTLENTGPDEDADDPADVE